MTKKKENKIFCVYCGTENDLSLKKCDKCGKELNPKNRPFRDYLKEKVEDKLEGDVQDELFAIMINFIKTHLYGSILTCSIIITAVSVVTNLVNNSNDFEEVSERPAISSKLVYIGDGLSSEDVMNKYLEALNLNDMKTTKALELETFYPEVFNSLKDKLADDNYTMFFSDNNLLTNRESLFNYDVSFVKGSSGGLVPTGKYGEYNFVRYAIFNNFCYENNCEKADNTFYIVNDLELIEVDGNYYVSGSEKELELSIDQGVVYNFLLDNKGDTSKFSKQDIDDYINNLQ